MEFDEILRFWYSCVARDAWIDLSSRTVELRPLKRRENLHFFSLSHLSLSVCFFLSFFSYFLSFFPPLLSLRNFFLFCSHPHLLISQFSLVSLLFSLLSFSPFTSLSLFLIPIIRIGQARKLPPHFPSLTHVILSIFLIFMIFFP